MNGSAWIEGDYRWSLTRWWGSGELMTFVGLNPSTATAVEDDATIRRCCGFARREAKAGIRMINLYALRSRDPSKLRAVVDPVGPRNEEAWRSAFDEEGLIVCAWGGKVLRGGEIRFLKRAKFYRVELWCLGVTKDGQPKHPLYLPADAPLRRFG